MTARTMGSWSLSGTALAMVLTAAGCSSSPSSSGAIDAGPSNGLTGMYVTSDDGPIQQFQFVDGSHVNVWWSECAGGNPCESLTTYTFDGSELVVTDPAGNVSTLGMAGIQSHAMTESDRIRLEGTSLGGSGGTSLGGGGGSTSLGGGGTPIALTELEELIVAFDIALVVDNTKPKGRSSGSGSGKGLTLCSGSQHFSSSSTFPNDRAAFDFFRAKGLSAAQAAGIVGNLDQESGVNPTVYQYGGGAGRGIAQWSAGGRWDSSPGDNAVAFAADEHGSVWSLQTQLEFIWYELTERGYGYSDLKNQTTVDGAEYAFQDYFEICGTCDESQRQAYAQTVYNAFSKDPVSSGSSGGMCTQSWGSCSADGESGSCVDTAACGGSGGVSTPGFCPGPSNIQCCTTPAKGSSGAGSDSAASLALSNVGDGACSTNSKGSHAFESSCTGNGGEPEYWCADFARWVWGEAGYDTTGLSAAAGSFYCYGKDHGTLHSSPAVGDAVVFDYGVNGECTANHVAIVTAVNSDGTIETVSGDWGGDSGDGEAHFASTSHVVKNTPAYPGSEGTSPSTMGGMTLSAFIAPAK